MHGPERRQKGLGACRFYDRRTSKEYHRDIRKRREGVMFDFLLRPDIEEKDILGCASVTTPTIASITVCGMYYSTDNSLADVATLRSFLITKNPNVCQGKPTILGTRIAVSNIVELYYLLGWDVQKIKDEYPHLSDEQILAAIEYYENHTKEIDDYLREEKEIDVKKAVA